MGLTQVHCNCRKNGCIKKYCECFRAGVSCTGRCSCLDCGNGMGFGPPAEDAATKRRRKLPLPPLVLPPGYHGSQVQSVPVHPWRQLPSSDFVSVEVRSAPAIPPAPLTI